MHGGFRFILNPLLLLHLLPLHKTLVTLRAVPFRFLAEANPLPERLGRGDLGHPVVDFLADFLAHIPVTV